MSLSSPTSVVTTGTLGGLFFNKINKGNPYNTPKLKEIHNLETFILGIATGQYAITIPMKDKRRVQRYRYLDWLITTPLLLKTFHALAEELGYEESFIPALTANIIMIVAGYNAEFLAKSTTARRMWYILGVVALVVVLFYVARWDSFIKEQGVDTKQIPTFFYVGWSLYGLNYLTPHNDMRQAGFNILDLFNKGIYALQLDNVLMENF